MDYYKELLNGCIDLEDNKKLLLIMQSVLNRMRNNLKILDKKGEKLYG